MSHIKQTEKCFDKLDEMKKTLCCWVEGAISSGESNVNAAELSAAVDMIKDIACAQKDIWESCYYKTVVDAMKEGEGDGGWENHRMGYNPNRNSLGQYSRGYEHPRTDIMRWPETMMGYSPSGAGTRSQSGSRMGYEDVYARMMPPESEDSERYGREFGRYRQARRHYTETNSPEKKREMEEHAEHHMNEAIATFKEIWREADPELRQKMKTDLTKLMGEMN